MVFLKSTNLKIISKAIEEQGFEYISCFQSKDLKLRPIVAGHKCPTKRLSNLILSIFYSSLIYSKLNVM